MKEVLGYALGEETAVTTPEQIEENLVRLGVEHSPDELADLVRLLKFNSSSSEISNLEIYANG